LSAVGVVCVKRKRIEECREHALKNKLLINGVSVQSGLTGISVKDKNFYRFYSPVVKSEQKLVYTPRTVF